MPSQITRCLVLVALLLSPLPLNAQNVLFFRVGVGSVVTETGRAVAHLDLRLPVSERFSAMAEVGLVAGPAACDTSWPSSFQCGYGGWLANVGFAAAVISAPRLRIAGSATAGSFYRRESSVGHALSPSVSLGVDAAARLTSRIWFDASIQNFWIRDSGYRGLFAEYPQIRMFTAGFGLTL